MGEDPDGDMRPRLRRTLRPLIVQALNKRDGRKAGEPLPLVDNYTAGWLEATGYPGNEGRPTDIADVVTEEILVSVASIRDHAQILKYYDECRARMAELKRQRERLERDRDRMTGLTGAAAIQVRDAARGLHDAIAAIGEAEARLKTEAGGGGRIIGLRKKEVARQARKVAAATVAQIMQSHDLHVSGTHGTPNKDEPSIYIKIIDAICDVHGLDISYEKWSALVSELRREGAIDEIAQPEGIYTKGLKE